MSQIDYKKYLKSKSQVFANHGMSQNDFSSILYPFERDIVKWALKKGRAAIFADCGLGKTLMQLEWARYINGNVLILAPLAVSIQTKQEGLKIDVSVNICKSQEDIRPGINITNYERMDKFVIKDFDGIVLDESSILKSYSGIMRNKIIELCQFVPYRLACTATPAPNDYMELGNHSEFLGVMSRTEMLATFFCHDGANTSQWRLKGHAQEKYWQWISSWAVLLKRPSDLGYENNGFVLPDLNIKVINCQSDYKPEGMLFANGSLSLNERRSARKTSIDSRADIVSGLIRQSQEPWIIWCDLNAEADALVKRIDGAIEIRGTDNPEEKEKNLMDFSNGRFKILITKPSIAGFGMNWQHCRNMVFMGLSDSYESYYQAIRRCWRFGQKSQVNIYVVISDQEMIILDNIKRKEMEFEKMGYEMVKHTSRIMSSEIKGTERMHEDYKTSLKVGNNWECYLGDCVEIIKLVETTSIGYIIFSPPFSSLYTYSASDHDMGNCKDDKEFADHFKFLIPELFRTLQSGRLCSFHCMNLPSFKERDGVIGLKDFRGELIRMFIECGFIYHSEVVIWKNPVTAMQRTKAIGLLHKQLKKDSSMSRIGIPDYVITMRKPGENKNPISHTPEEFPVSLWQKWASPVWMDINPSNTLQRDSAREEKDERHIAPLQLDVIERCITLWSNKNDIVLSPFAGIGSEGYQALKMGRRFIGIELKSSYWEQAIKNLEIAEQSNIKLI